MVHRLFALVGLPTVGVHTHSTHRARRLPAVSVHVQWFYRGARHGRLHHPCDQRQSVLARLSHWFHFVGGCARSQGKYVAIGAWARGMAVVAWCVAPRSLRVSNLTCIPTLTCDSTLSCVHSFIFDSLISGSVQLLEQCPLWYCLGCVGRR